MVQLPWLVGALCQAGLGQHRGTPSLQQQGAGSGCRLACQAVQKEQCKVSGSMFLPQMKRGTG